MAKIFSVAGKVVLGRILEPVANTLLRLHVTPNMVTTAGTVGVLVGAIGFGARGHFIIGLTIVTLSCFTDTIDGLMARKRGGTGKFGALLDSSMDRISDGAIFGSVAFWLAGEDRMWALAAALLCLVSGQVVSYVKARAEGLGYTANVGIAERTERLILVGIGGLGQGLGLWWVLDGALWLLFVLGAITVGQRMWTVYVQDRAAHPMPPRGTPAAAAPGTAEQ
jgi:CDP-diacylglycerol--glycerol-3-phosphate 3-phosphatidyltransferase